MLKVFKVVDFNEVQAVFSSFNEAVWFAACGQDASPNAYVVDEYDCVVFWQ